MYCADRQMTLSFACRQEHTRREAGSQSQESRAPQGEIVQLPKQRVDGVILPRALGILSGCRIR